MQTKKYLTCCFSFAQIVDISRFQSETQLFTVLCFHVIKYKITPNATGTSSSGGGTISCLSSMKFLFAKRKP